MSPYACRRLWWPPPRPVCSQQAALHRAQPLRWVVVTRDRLFLKGKPGPAQSELLRFALTRAEPNIRGTQWKGRYGDVFMENWPSNSSPSPYWAPRPRALDDLVKTRGWYLFRAQNLRQLQNYIEASVITSRGARHFMPQSRMLLLGLFERCERHNTYGDILAFINGVDTRVKRLKGGKYPETSRILHIMGLNYACLALSASSLEHHLRGYFAACPAEPLGLIESREIVDSLLFAVQTLQFQDSKPDVGKLLEMVTGTVGSDCPNLHEISYWARGEVGPVHVGEYLSLLVHLGDDVLRHTIWERYLQLLLADPGFRDYHSAYLYARSLVDVGNTSEAQGVLKGMSERSGNSLPRITSFKGLNGLLRNDAVRETVAQLANEYEHKKLLKAELTCLERRIGVRWLPQKGEHVGITNSATDRGRPIMDIYGNSLGYESPERLKAEIQALGCSKSAAEIARVAEILDNYDGDLIPISIPVWPGTDTQLYWAPERSPLELSNKSTLDQLGPQHASIQSLGLIKVTSSQDNRPFAHEPSLHLLQLGYILKRKKISGEEESGLEETGYIMAWNRATGKSLAVFAGVGHGTINRSTEFQTGDSPPGCDTIMEIEPSNDPQRRGPRIRFPKYRLERDPCPDLVLDIKT